MSINCRVRVGIFQELLVEEFSDMWDGNFQEPFGGTFSGIRAWKFLGCRMCGEIQEL
jgi:hypothetical protein